MLLPLNFGDLFSLMREIETIIASNKVIPARLDTACTYVIHQNKSNLFLLNEKVKAINEKFVNKNEDGSLKMVDAEMNGQPVHQYDIPEDLKAQHREAIEDLMRQPVLVKVQQIQMADLGHIVFNKTLSDYEAFKRIMINGMD